MLKRNHLFKVIAFAVTMALVVSTFITTGILSTSAATLSSTCTESAWESGSVYTGGNIVCFNGHHWKAKWWTQGEEPGSSQVWADMEPCPNGGTPTPTSTNPTSTPVTTYYASGYVNTDIVSTYANLKEGFKVELIAQSSGYTYNATTDANGYFMALGSTLYTYDLKISKPNYLARTIKNLPSSVIKIGTEINPIVMWAGDLNADGAINMTDIMKMIQYFNSAKGDTKYDVSFDFNLDNAINMTDIMIIVKNFNKTADNYPDPVIGIPATPTATIPNTPTPATPSPTPTASLPTPTTTTGGDLPDRILVGYWHNFDNGSTTIKLRDVSKKWDVICVAFAEPISQDRATMGFEPFNATPEEFKSDIAYLNSLGKKVILSIGGANGHIELSDTAGRDNFVKSMSALVDKYGFDGIDIDLEGSSLSLNAGDTDLKNPKTPKIVNLISAFKTLCGRYGSDFILSMAPETAYVQGGLGAYGGPWGAYLPVIDALRNEMTYIHVQHYNTGSMTALDGKAYNQSTADFQVAMAEVLLQGFNVANNPNNYFAPLRPDQVAIGLPACRAAAPSGGYTTPADVHKALDYLIKGKSFGGSYKLQNPNGYAGFRGLMTWSVNWDAATNYEFSNNHRAYLDGLQ